MLLRSSLSPSPPPLPSIHTQTYRSLYLLLKPSQKNLKISLHICNSRPQEHRNEPVRSTGDLKWSAVYSRVIGAHRERKPVSKVLEDWDRLERRLTKWEICRIAKELRKYRHFYPALQVHEWMAAQGDRFFIKSSDMAILLDLIAKVHGFIKAEKYFYSLPESYKDKRTYCSLLNMYVQSKSREKAESIYHLMHENNYITDALPYNIMMTLYLNSHEYEKVEEIIREMSENKMDFDVYTYNIWISTVSAMENTDQLEIILRIMESDNVNPNWTTYTTLASMYIKNGIYDKAIDCLKEAEFRMSGKNRSPFYYFMNLYGSMGNKDEMYRIWNLYKRSFPVPLNVGYKHMMNALVKLEDIEGVEKIYEDWLNCAANFDPRMPQILMSYYCSNGFSNKAKETIDRFVQRGGKPNSFTWDVLVYGFTKEKNVGEALFYLKKAFLGAVNSNENLKWRPKLGVIGGFFDVCKEWNERESMVHVVNFLKQGGWIEREPMLGELIEKYVGFVTRSA